jgi:predicted NUDIX family NTP pyrophosphohydrolase
MEYRIEMLALCRENAPMSKNLSAGLLMYRQLSEAPQGLEFFLVHPGGPYFRQKDKGWWGIPKGLPHAGEDLLQTAQREFEEETGISPRGPYVPLESIKQKGGKTVWAWAFTGNWQEAQGIRCNTFKVEWPYKSGKWQHYPEIDGARWFSYQQAREWMLAAQLPFIERLNTYFGNIGPPSPLAN